MASMYRRVSAGVLAVVAFLAVSCGDDDGGGVEAQTWANDVCTALDGWIKSVQETTINLQSEVISAGSSVDPEAAKTKLIGYLDDAKADTAAMVDAVEAAGTPDVDRGEEVATELVEVLSGIEEIFDDAKAKAVTLDTSDPGSFATNVTAIGEEAEKAFDQIGDAFGDIGTSDELEQAFDEAEACKTLAG